MRSRHYAFLAGALWMAAIDRFFFFEADWQPLVFPILVLGGLLFLRAVVMDKEAKR